ncbi:MAG: alkaline phosphatase D family protein [Planctomycetota bacterium]
MRTESHLALGRRLFIAGLASAAMTLRRAWAAVVPRRDRVTLPEAHRGTLEIDTRLLDSYLSPDAKLRKFYFRARDVFASKSDASFTDQAIVKAAEDCDVTLMGGPLLGDLRSDGVTVWLRPASDHPCEVRVGSRSFSAHAARAGEVVRIRLSGLNANQRYRYTVAIAGDEVASGDFTTAPGADARDVTRITFGSCFHKIGLHNPNLVQTIRSRQPHAMMLLGDLAVDDRRGNVSMHRADYQLRDVAPAWRELASHVPLFATWDDHDYFDNDLSGVPRKFQTQDRDAVREIWRENWNNPVVESSPDGIYFSTRVGPVEVIMLDTRSCRDNKRRNEYGSYLGEAQLTWLKDTLTKSSAKFKVISSGTMWSDYVSKAKDSWGSWDTQAREELFQLIEDEGIGGVLLVSGDRHGARGFRIPRPSGFDFYEFEPATLGGVSGPAGRVEGCPEQLFGYSGRDNAGQDFIAFGEFTFDMTTAEPSVTFRLITEIGELKEEIPLQLETLTPKRT